MDIRFVAYDRLGDRRGVLPHTLQSDFVGTKNELSTLTMTYPRQGIHSQWLDDSPEVAMEFLRGKKWIEPVNARFRLQSSDFDHLEEVQTRVYTFLGIGEAVRGIYLFSNLGLPVSDENKVQFGDTTVGDILGKVWEGARSRGWSGFEKTWTDKADSNGMPWAEKVNVSFDMDASFESIMMYFVRGGLLDFHWHGRSLRIYNNGGASRDLTSGTGDFNQIRFNLSGGPTGVDSAPEMTDREAMATHVIVNGENGLRWEFPTGAQLPEGRREVFLSYSGVDEEATARILAQPTIVKYSNALKNTTRQFRIGEGVTIQPYHNYLIGDWVLVEKTDGEWERMMIYTLSLTLNENGLQGYVGLGDKIDTLLEILHERVQRVTGGSATESPDPITPSDRSPSPVKTLSVGTDTYINNWGIPTSSVTVSWTHDGKDLTGLPVNIDRYSVQYRNEGSGTWSELFTVTSPSMQGTYSPLDTYHPDGSFRTYQFRVFVYSTKGAISSSSPLVSVTTRADTSIPDKPSTPIVTTQHGLYTIVTDHMTDSDLSPQGDYSHVIVQMATAPNGVEWVDVGYIQRPNTSFTIGNQGYVTRWFRLIAVDTTGNRSEPSDSAAGTTKPLVDVDIILEVIDAAQTEIINAGKILLEGGIELDEKLADADKAIADTNTSLTGPGGLTERLTGAEKKLSDVGALTYATGQTLRQKLTASDTAITNTTTTLNNLRNVVIPALDDGLGAAEDRLDEAEGRITENRSELDTAKGDIAEAQELITSNATVMGNAVTRLGTAETEITNAKKRLTDAETRVSTLRDTTIPKLTDDLGKATGRLTDAEGDITDAQAELTELARRLEPIEVEIPNLVDSIDGKTTINRQTTVASNPGDYSLGDRWERWDKLTVGGKLLQSWRHNGTAWIEEILDATYLPSIDIGSGTYGSLSGGRLTANSVSAGQINAEEVAGAVGKFLKVTTDQLIAGEANLGSAVAQKIAAGTASFQTVDIKNLFVSGTTSLTEVVAKRLAAETGTFITLTTNQLTAGTANLDSAVAQKIAAATATFQKADISNLTAGSANMTQAVIDKLVANTASFQKVKVENITATATANLNNVVAQRIASGTASFQTVDAKNIFVTGTASLTEVVAKRLASETGSFITLGVDQLTVTGTANMKEAVADRMFTNIFSTNKLTANQVIIGRGLNVIPDPGHLEPTMLAARNTHSSMGVTLTNTNDLALTPSATANTYFRPLGVPQNTIDFKNWIPVKPGQVWKWGASFVSVRSAGTFIKFVGRTLDGQDYAAPTKAADGKSAPSTTLPIGTSTQEVTAIIPDGCYWLMPEMTLTPGTLTTWIDQGSMFMVQMSDSSLLVDGAVTARTIEASEEMSAKVGQFLKLDVVDLVSTGTAKINEAVVTKLFSETFSTRKLLAENVIIGQPGNAFPDPEFKDAPGWAAASVTIGAGLGRNGANAIVVDNKTTTGQMGVFYGNYDRGKYSNITGGQTYVFSVWVRPNVAIAAGAITVMAKWTNANSSEFGEFATPYAITNKAIAAGVWTRLEGKFEFPAAATQAFFGFFTESFAKTPVRFSDPSLLPAVSTNLVVEGAIVTRHLTVTEDMTVALLKAHKVKAGEIDVNSLTADTGFIASLKVTLLKANTITSDMLASNAITAKHSITGALVQTHSGLTQGIKLMQSSMVGYDANSAIRFRLDAITGELTARGQFTSIGTRSSVTLGWTAGDGYRRPGLTFKIDGLANAIDAQIFTEGDDNQANNYSVGGLILMGGERVGNSSGRSEIVLNGGGVAGYIGTSWGPNDETGFSWEGAYAEIMGKMRDNGSRAKTQLRTGAGTAASIGAGGYGEWTFTHPAPPPHGLIRPFLSVDAIPGTGVLVAATVSHQSRTSFRGRVTSSGAVHVYNLFWFGIWVD